MGQDLCSSISGLHENIISAVLVNDGSIVQWKAGPGVKMPGQKEMEGIALQRLIMMSIAKAHQSSGNVHFNVTRYDEFDVLLFDLQQARKDALLLIVNVRRPYALESLAGGIMNIAKGA
ncbi:MAG: hypothetical protein ACREAY_05840 [Nitrososphaera sp.]|uniref:hypothetical protein n=1 Tax=Nitrososphaera sp. TaxID=1971748 RepID=UPI003D6DE8E6